MSLPPGARLGPYEIQSLLGVGGMGEVYRAQDARLQREVAIKVHPAHLSDDPEMRKRLEREARAASALNHPQICTIYDVGEQQGCYFIAMELIDGHPLSTAIAGRPLPMQEVLHLGIQIADALEAAHKHGIVHRDLKPSNIFVTTRGDAKVLDFGLAKQLASAGKTPASDTMTMLTAQHAVVGTVSYMSPEQAQGQEVDTRSDIFSFGAVIYEMCTGHQAFGGTSSAGIFAAILRGQPALPNTLNPAVPDELQRVIGKSIEKDRADRYQSAAELLIDLKRLKRQLFESSGKLAAPYNPSHARGKALLVAATLLALLLISVVFLVSTATPKPELLDLQQITYSSERKDAPLVTDGSRLYFQSDNVPAEMSVNGGAIAPLRASTTGMTMIDVSHDGSELLAFKSSVDDESFRGSVWSVPVLGGSPRRLGNEMATSARWLPDGRSLIYIYLRSVFLTGVDGSNPKKIWEGPGNVGEPGFSPDGRRIRLTVVENHHSRIWELNADGSKPHRLALGFPDDADQSHPQWTPDGQHFIVQSSSDGANNLYEVVEPRLLAFWKKPLPAKLTSGEMEIVDAIPSRDSKQLFALGRVAQGAMQVYDARQKRFAPFPGGLAAAEFVISPDKQWMVYTDFPRHFLWRSRLDGSEKLQLTNSYAAWPRWSPDGKTIAYMDWSTIYLIASEGGTPSKLIGGDGVATVAPEWTPDGKAITFNDFPKLDAPLKGVQQIDLATRKVSVIHGSEGFYVGSWSPDGRRMVAVAQNPLRMMLFDVQSKTWKLLHQFKDPWGYWVWTRDSSALFLAQTLGDRGIFKLTIATGRWERVTSLEGINMVDQVNESFMNLTVDGDPAIMNDTSVAQIFALKWKH
jgi:serine/threonine protein kinase